jgi:hypothetical protein
VRLVDTSRAPRHATCGKGHPLRGEGRGRWCPTCNVDRRQLARANRQPSWETHRLSDGNEPRLPTAPFLARLELIAALDTWEALAEDYGERFGCDARTASRHFTRVRRSPSISVSLADRIAILCGTHPVLLSDAWREVACA